ncbi:Salutaridinol 7-O-acetyltransferase, putative [Ricinus communis]|uniref:Salutaridinol 7-O-acetyltransferase, putative n=1 Tax=Ricinus communis TaxID=3988 RepID=B9R8M3_RICCO|nr:Salutaridinol 7-O-acetyltransferase, putative [Ricinus communis]
MKMEVQIVSKEDVKPSIPTSPHLRTFQLSLLEQLMPPHSYAPIVLFYPMNKSSTHLDVTKRLKLLKTSLSETLTLFYPLAGKIENELSIDCNDEGANFVETRVNCCLDEFLIQPDLMLINKFLPFPLIVKESAEKIYVTNIQANVFECGGIAIGICISHKILDGAALSTFIKGWTTTARPCKEVVYPKFTAASLFPANDLWLRDSSEALWGSFFRKGDCITRRLVFDASAIDKLKEKATCSVMKCPTRVEAVSAFLWKSAVAASAEFESSYKNGTILVKKFVGKLPLDITCRIHS